MENPKFFRDDNTLQKHALLVEIGKAVGSRLHAHDYAGHK